MALGGRRKRESGRIGEGRLARQRATLAVGASFLQNPRISSLAEWWLVDGAVRIDTSAGRYLYERTRTMSMEQTAPWR